MIIKYLSKGMSLCRSVATSYTEKSSNSARNIVNLEKVQETIKIVKGKPIKKDITITTINNIHGDKTELARRLMNDIPNLGTVYRYNDQSISFRSKSVKDVIDWLEKNEDVYLK